MKGAVAGDTLVVSTSQKYLWTSTALTVSEMILVHYTCNVRMLSFSKLSHNACICPMIYLLCLPKRIDVFYGYLADATALLCQVFYV